MWEDWKEPTERTLPSSFFSSLFDHSACVWSFCSSLFLLLPFHLLFYFFSCPSFREFDHCWAIGLLVVFVHSFTSVLLVAGRRLLSFSCSSFGSLILLGSFATYLHLCWGLNRLVQIQRTPTSSTLSTARQTSRHPRSHTTNPPPKQSNHGPEPVIDRGGGHIQGHHLPRRPTKPDHPRPPLARLRVRHRHDLLRHCSACAVVGQTRREGGQHIFHPGCLSAICRMAGRARLSRHIYMIWFQVWTRTHSRTHARMREHNSRQGPLGLMEARMGDGIGRHGLEWDLCLFLDDAARGRVCYGQQVPRGSETCMTAFLERGLRV
ncbi:hypothetical protein B0T19DRAFT_434991 [Cercophora scortea]|uniref:Transmembrane protein n=1 Tax=Cercophora scortea TaxID=314031 RepID=A0AAE0M360_9PEZI|nr:hypothetical protein B0T19DRAFT_434991 [Cercophora scortea]